MLTISLVILVFIAAGYAFRSIIVGNKKIDVNEQILFLVDRIETKKSLADKSKCGIKSIKLYEDREEDIQRLSGLIRGSYISSPKASAQVYDISDRVGIEKAG